MKHRKTLFVAALAGTLAVGCVTGAVATNGSVTKELFYRDIKITLNGSEITPRDVNGNAVEPFIIDGTTYLPVRGIGSAMGLDVGWDGDTSTVILTEPGAPSEPQASYTSAELNSQISATSYSVATSWGDLYCYVIATNNSNTTVSISSNAVAKDAAGNPIAAGNASEEAVGPGCTVCLPNRLEDAAESAASVSYSYNASQETIYTSVDASLTHSVNITDKKAIISVTNNGAVPAEFVQVYCLFFKDGEIVDADYTYFTDNDSELKPGATIVKELDTREEFDSVQVYPHGRYYGR